MRGVIHPGIGTASDVITYDYSMQPMARSIYIYLFKYFAIDLFRLHVLYYGSYYIIYLALDILTGSHSKIYLLLCKAVLALRKFDAYFFICEVSRGWHYNSLYALILHSILAHHQVPFSSGVSQNKRTSTL